MINLPLKLSTTIIPIINLIVILFWAYKIYKLGIEKHWHCHVCGEKILKPSNTWLEKDGELKLFCSDCEKNKAVNIPCEIPKDSIMEIVLHDNEKYLTKVVSVDGKTLFTGKSKLTL